MISEQTVFVLGAGTNMEYGFPSGNELLKNILKSLDTDKIDDKNNIVRKLKELNHEETLIDQFHKSLNDYKKTRKPSIDNFLESHEEFVDIGKQAITLNLIPLEKKGLVKEANNDHLSWYKYLFNNIEPLYEEYLRPNLCQKLTIVTFNYDRSLEHYLYTLISNGCKNNTVNVPILHVYGKIGFLLWEPHWMGYPNNSRRPYNDKISNVDIEAVSEQIMTIAESKKVLSGDLRTNYQTALLKLSQAKHIYFLGFGYSEDNLKKLKIETHKGTEMKGTGFGLSNEERKEIESNWNIEIDPNPEHKILDFLKNNAVLE